MDVKLGFANALSASEFKFELATMLADQLSGMPYPERKSLVAGVDKTGDTNFKERQIFEGMLTAFKPVDGVRCLGRNARRAQARARLVVGESEDNRADGEGSGGEV